MMLSLLPSGFAFAALMSACSAVHAAAPTPVSSGFQMLFGLVVVLGLMMGLAWWLKRFGPARNAGNAPLKIVGGVSVGARERVMVIEVADQWIVVGVAPGSVTTLSTMPRQETSASLPTNAVPANFSGWLKQTIDRRNGKV